MSKNNEQITLADVVVVPTKCSSCGAEGTANTLQWIVDDTTTVLGGMLETNGYVDVTCPACEPVFSNFQ